MTNKNSTEFGEKSELIFDNFEPWICNFSISNTIESQLGQLVCRSSTLKSFFESVVQKNDNISETCFFISFFKHVFATIQLYSYNIVIIVVSHAGKLLSFFLFNPPLIWKEFKAFNSLVMFLSRLFFCCFVGFCFFVVSSKSAAVRSVVCFPLLSRCLLNPRQLLTTHKSKELGREKD